MKKELLYESVSNNLNELRHRSDIIREQRDIVLTELIDNIFANARDESPDSLYREFLSALPSAELSDKLKFADSLTSRLNAAQKDIPALLGDSDTSAEAGAHGKIAYVRNRYNDEAYSKLSAAVPHAKAVYCSDFEACCEAVASGKCEFTILPLDDTSDGKMFGFYSLLDRYELKIACTCSIEREHPSKTIRYSLASKGFRPDLLNKSKKESRRYFEFSLTNTPTPHITDIYRAAAEFSAPEHRTSSISLPYSDNLARFYHSFAITKDTKILPFILFLSLEYPQYTPIGIYCEI